MGTDILSVAIYVITNEIVVLSEKENHRTEAPFGEAIADALQAALEKGQQLGFSPKNVDGYAGVLDMGTSGELMGAMAHLDIVPAGGGWTYPPFSGTIADGKLYGRGSLDDKGPLAATLYAMKAVDESGLPFRNRFRLIIGTDEETACRCLAHYLKKEPPLAGGFSPDGEFPVIYGEKGGLQLSCEKSWRSEPCISEAFQLLNLHAGTRINVVPEFAEASLGGSKELWEKLQQELEHCIEKDRYAISADDNFMITVSATGVGAHAATPWQGDNALCALLRFLRRLPLGPSGAADYVNALSDLFGNDYDGTSAGIACQDAISTPLTMCMTMLRIEDGHGCARFDLRYPLSKMKDEIMKVVCTAAQKRGLEITLDRANKPLYIPAEDPLVQNLLCAYREVTGRTEKPITIGGGTYCREMPNTVAFGPVFPREREVAHEADEFITIDNLITCAKIYAQAIYALVR